MKPIQELLNRYQSDVLPTLSKHVSHDLAEEEKIIRAFSQFIESHDNLFSRENSFGHFTGSALVVSPDLKQVLLTHHKKLNMWIQLGGHADGEEDLTQVALSEAQEESGIHHLEFWKHPTPQSEPLPFDLDFHHIPDGTQEGHIHFDVRFLLIASHKEHQISDESHDLQWWNFEEAYRLNPERSMERQYHKAQLLLA